MKDNGTDNSFAHCISDLLHAGRWILTVFVVSLLLVGCATSPAEAITPTVLRYQLEGRNIVEHRDTQDSPCGQSYGCYLVVQCTQNHRANTTSGRRVQRSRGRSTTSRTISRSEAGGCHEQDARGV